MASFEQKETFRVQSISNSDSHDEPSPIDQHVDSSVPAINNKAIINEAAENVNFEHNLTVRQALKYYKWAIFWSLAVRYAFVSSASCPGLESEMLTTNSMTVVMEGYDLILVGNFFAYPTFQKKYGVWVGVSETTRSGYQLTPAWQAGLGNGAVVGCFIGKSRVLPGATEV